MNFHHRRNGRHTSRRQGKATVATMALAVIGAAIFSGCTSPGYKLAHRTLPPVPLNLPSTEPPVEALLHTVIVYRGPGSWKENAFWDEYVVTVANRGSAPVTIESARLVDSRKQITTAGSDPWELERASRSFADLGFGFAKGTAIQIGGGATAVAVGGGIGAAAFAGSIFSGAGVAAGGILALPAFVGGSIYTNLKSRGAIAREFERRRLALPALLVPGELVHGSLFFRITPGPTQLRLQCRIDDEPREVVIDLAPIAGLHLSAPSNSQPPTDNRTAR